MQGGHTKVDEFREKLKKKRDIETKQDSKSATPVEKAMPVSVAKNAKKQSSKSIPVALEKKVSELEAKLTAANEKAQSDHEKLLHMMAEFENSKKRMKKEREDLVRFGNDKLLSDLLPSLDDLDRVLEHIPESVTEDVNTLAQGVELVRKSLLATLKKHDLTVVNAIGQVFDPNQHEAIAMVDGDKKEAGKVISVHRQGYFLGTRLLRPAMVSVVKE